MNNTFIITDFGAKGDGVTDCTSAIQTALDKASDCMGSVIVPPGRYSVGKLHMHGRAVSLVGTPAWSFGSDGASIFTLNDNTVDCMLDISGAFGCTIKGMCLDGNHCMGNGIHGIKLYWEKYNGGSEEDTPTVDECRVGNFSGDGLHFEHVWCFSVRHSMIHRNKGAGLYIDGWDAFILDNWFSANLGGGIMGGPVVASITCTGNRVEWNHRGGFILPNGDSYNITGNFFDRSFGPALEIGGNSTSVRMVTVTGNIFRRSGARQENSPLLPQEMSCHLNMQRCTGAVVSGNSARVGTDDGGVGVVTPDYGFIVTDCTECIIKDNALASASLVENMVLNGDNSTCIIRDNIGTIQK